MVVNRAAQKRLKEREGKTKHEQERNDFAGLVSVSLALCMRISWACHRLSCTPLCLSLSLYLSVRPARDSALDVARELP